MEVVEEDSEVARCRVRDAVWGVLGAGVSESAYLRYAGWARLGSDACDPSLCVLGGRTVWAERQRKEGGDAQRPRTPGTMQARQAMQARQVRKGVSGQVDWTDAGCQVALVVRAPSKGWDAGPRSAGASSLRLGAQDRSTEARARATPTRGHATAAAHAADAAQLLCRWRSAYLCRARLAQALASDPRPHPTPSHTHHSVSRGCIGPLAHRIGPLGTEWRRD